MTLFLLAFRFDISHTHTHTHTHTDRQTDRQTDNTQRHTAHTQTNRLTHQYKLCAHCSSLYYIEWIICWYQKFTLKSSAVFAFQTLLTCTSHISVD